MPSGLHWELKAVRVRRDALVAARAAGSRNSLVPPAALNEYETLWGRPPEFGAGTGKGWKPLAGVTGAWEQMWDGVFADAPKQPVRAE